MNLRVLKRLHDALDSAEAVASFIAGKTQQDYLSYRLLRSAVERELEKAGEALFVPDETTPISSRSCRNCIKSLDFGIGLFMATTR